MDYLTTAIALISEAAEEKQRLEKMTKALDKLTYKTPDYWTRRCEIEKKYSPTPRKSVINENIKIARRLLNRAYIK